MGRGVNLFRAPIRRARAEALFNRNGAKDAGESAAERELARMEAVPLAQKKLQTNRWHDRLRELRMTVENERTAARKAAKDADTGRRDGIRAIKAKIAGEAGITLKRTDRAEYDRLERELDRLLDEAGDADEKKPAAGGYNAEAVQKALESSRQKIGGKEARAIHSLLRGWRGDVKDAEARIIDLVSDQAKDADEVEDAGGYDRDQLEKDRAEVAALVKAAGLKNMGGGEWGRSYEAPVTVTLYGADWTIDRRGKSGEKTRLASDTGAAALRMKLALLD